MTTDTIFPSGNALTPINVPFNAGDFNAVPNGSWTVEAGDVISYWYSILGPGIALITFRFEDTVVDGSAINECQLTLPNGWVAKEASAAYLFLVNGATFVDGVMILDIDTNFIKLKRSDGSAFTLDSNNDNTFSGQIVIQFK